MIKHIGRHGQRKLVVVFRQLQGDQEHMALVLYTDVLPANYHDGIMKVLESEVGQQATDFADAMHRNLFNDGMNMLQTVHNNGWLKKVPTKQIILTVNAKSSCRLDELNVIMKQLEEGGEGARKMAELDAQSGMYDPANNDKIVDVDQFAKTTSASVSDLPSEPVDIPIHGEGVFDDTMVAKQTLQQAEQMEAQSQSLAAEAKRLKEEAYSMSPSLKPKRKYTKRKAKEVEA